MKKFLAIALVLAMILALGVSAFAASSPSKGGEPADDGVAPVPFIYTGPPLKQENKEVKNIKITDKDGNEIPVKLIPYEDLEKAGLDEETLKAAEEDYKKAAAATGKKCLKWFWLLPEDVDTVVSADEPVNLEFDTDATDVEAQLNAVALELLENDGNHYKWELPGFGGVGIYGN